MGWQSKIAELMVHLWTNLVMMMTMIENWSDKLVHCDETAREQI
jgi:ABC-type Zn uptake system ZnuABC Zn-binding protein ZnuA